MFGMKAIRRSLSFIFGGGADGNGSSMGSTASSEGSQKGGADNETRAKRKDSLESVNDFLEKHLGETEGVTLEVMPGKEVTGPLTDVNVLVRVKTPEGKERLPVDICCVIDVSGSMGAEATILGSSGERESHGLSLLDVAKHGVKTVAHTLNKDDRLAVIKFDHGAETVLELTSMDEDGVKLADDKVDALFPQGGTDIWKGLKQGFDALKAGRELPSRWSHLLLLTDGKTLYAEQVQGNVKKYKEEENWLPCTTCTFGFGYNIDSRLLGEIAREGGGLYSFIPDAGFVGTVFVNTMSNMLVTMARDVSLKLRAGPGAKILRVLGHQQVEIQEADLHVIQLGPLQYGQDRDILLSMSIRQAKGHYLTAQVVYFLAPDCSVVEPKALQACAPDHGRHSEIVEVQHCRCRYIDALAQALQVMQAGPPQPSEANLQQAQDAIKGALESIQASTAASTDQVVALIEDVGGQSTEAVSRGDWYWKWGLHYLPSIMCAHVKQQCNNFKDPGVQAYGGSLFEEIREQADDVFNELPAPKASRQARTFGVSSSSLPAAAPLDMAAYNNRYAGCIDGACTVQLESGKARRIKDLEKGDRVVAVGDVIATVSCIVRARCFEGWAKLVELAEGLRLSPRHPVLLDGDWCFPGDLRPAQDFPCDAVYSVILEGGAAAPPALLVGGIPCVALGHGLRDGLAYHPYFGTQRAIQDVARLPGFDIGLVDLPEDCVHIRDPMTGLVCGLQYEGLQQAPGKA